MEAFGKSGELLTMWDESRISVTELIKATRQYIGRKLNTKQNLNAL